MTNLTLQERMLLLLSLLLLQVTLEQKTPPSR